VEVYLCPVKERMKGVLLLLFSLVC
jgi:hypothetical protein